MHRLAPVVIALLVLTSVAARAETRCTKPLPPDLPSASASSLEMDRFGKEVDVYVKQMSEYRACLVKVIGDADKELNAVIEGWNFAVREFAARKRGSERDR
jgi:hypothetical protein